MARRAQSLEIPEPTPAERPERAEPRDTLTVGDDLIEVELRDVDLVAADLSHVRLVRSGLRSVQLTAARLRAVTLVDVTVDDSELSGADLHDASLTRVEFRNCRMVGVNLSEASFRHVRFTDCKLDDANLRFATLDHVWAEASSFVEADAYEAKVAATRFERCDLTRVDLSRATVTALDLRGSTVDGLRGAAGLRRVTIGVEQVVPFAVSVFAETGVRIV